MSRSFFNAASSSGASCFEKEIVRIDPVSFTDPPPGCGSLRRILFELIADVSTEILKKFAT